MVFNKRRFGFCFLTELLDKDGKKYTKMKSGNIAQEKKRLNQSLSE